MAKYTELLIQYLSNHSLPSKFSDIDGFEDMFIERYCNCELGFETENLFSYKINLITNLYFDDYKLKINQMNELMNKLINPTKTRTITDVKGAVESEQTNKNYEYPYNSSSLEDTQITSGEQVNSKINSTTDTRTNVVSGTNAYENVRLIEELNKSIKNYKNELLELYRTCFMEIY